MKINTLDSISHTIMLIRSTNIATTTTIYIHLFQIRAILLKQLFLFLGEPETDPILKPFLARFKNWGNWPFNYPCSGQWVKQVVFVYKCWVISCNNDFYHQLISSNIMPFYFVYILIYICYCI